ncbi:MAG: carbohydrate ABC transporter substrate-binding protein [Ruminococcus sp.]|nr:carbohydrate ABC transporter substrate-binding protein [Ruminococcus sp.]
MEKIRHIIAVSVSALIFTSAAAGCSDEKVIKEHKQQTEISFSWWGNDIRNEYTLAAVSKFEELHPDIKVDCSYSEWSGFEARSRVRMISNTEADVMQINFGWLEEYSSDGDGYYDLEKQRDLIDISSFTDEQLEFGRMNGVLNALPIAMNTETLYFNKTLFDKYGISIPHTWDDLFDAAKVMSKDEVFPLSGSKKSIWLLLLAYAEQTCGKALLDENGDLQFKPKDFQIMLEEYKKMTKEKVIPQVEYFVRTEIDSEKYAGAVAWVSDADNYFKECIKKGDEILIGDYPSYDPEKSGAGWYTKPAQLYAVSRDTEQPEEAAMLLDFLVNSKEMALLQGVEKGIPLSSVARKYIDEQGMLNGIQYEASQHMEDNKETRSMDPFLEDSDVIDCFMKECNEVLFGKSSIEYAANTLYKTAKEVNQARDEKRLFS